VARCGPAPGVPTLRNHENEGHIMGIMGMVLLALAIFFFVLTLTVILGGISRRADRDLLRRSAQDAATGEGGLTLPPDMGGPYRDQPA
jgi:hypothetical protein